MLPMFDDVARVVPHLKAIISTIEAIETEEAPEVISAYIGVLQESEDAICQVWGGKKDVRDCIRQGSGDFGRIKEKCVSLGLV